MNCTINRSLDLSHLDRTIVLETADTKKWNLFGGPTKLKFENCEKERLFPHLIAQVR